MLRFILWNRIEEIILSVSVCIIKKSKAIILAGFSSLTSNQKWLALNTSY